MGRPGRSLVRAQRLTWRGLSAQCHLVFGLSEAILSAAAPLKTRVGAMFAAFRKSTLGRHF